MSSRVYYFKCQGFDHNATNYINKTLFIKEKKDIIEEKD